MNNEQAILDTLEILSEIYGQEPGKPEAYFWTLEEYPGDTIKAAAKLHVKHSKWFPKPSELAEACQRAQAEMRSPLEDDRRRYWLAMEEHGIVLRGDANDRTLDTSKAWGWYQRTSPGPVDDPEAWAIAVAEFMPHLQQAEA